MDKIEIPDALIPNERKLDNEISTVLEEMQVEHADTETYTKMAENLETLCSAKSEYERNRHPHTGEIISAAASICCILLILNYEEEDIITTKALNFVPRPHR